MQTEFQVNAGHPSFNGGLLRRLRFAFAGFALAASILSAQGQTNNSKPEVISVFTALLEYKEVPFEAATGFANVKPPCVFKKEPVFGTNKVVLGMLCFGENTNDYLPFAWVPSRGELYLDLNRNLDLTDDLQFNSPSFKTNRVTQSFSGILLSYPHAAGLKKYRVRLTFQEKGGDVTVMAGFYSFWQGKINLHEREYQVGMIEDPFPNITRYLLLRPWADREKAFCARQGAWDAFGLEEHLFFDNQGLRLVTSMEPGDRVPLVRLTGYPDAKKTGKIQIVGKFIHRLVLSEKGGTVAVLDSPEGEVEIPVGKYIWGQAVLKAREMLAYPTGDFVGTNFNVVAGKALILPLGGPLINCVEVSRDKKWLFLSYKLMGVGKKPYKLANEDPSNLAQFKVYKGPHTMASGKFAYG